MTSDGVKIDAVFEGLKARPLLDQDKGATWTAAEKSEL
jgi:hypothetical protein